MVRCLRIHVCMGQIELVSSCEMGWTGLSSNGMESSDIEVRAAGDVLSTLGRTIIGIEGRGWLVPVGSKLVCRMAG